MISALQALSSASPTFRSSSRMFSWFSSSSVSLMKLTVCLSFAMVWRMAFSQSFVVVCTSCSHASQSQTVSCIPNCKICLPNWDLYPDMTGRLSTTACQIRANTITGTDKWQLRCSYSRLRTHRILVIITESVNKLPKQSMPVCDSIGEKSVHKKPVRHVSNSSCFSGIDWQKHVKQLRVFTFSCMYGNLGEGLLLQVWQVIILKDDTKTRTIDQRPMQNVWCLLFVSAKGAGSPMNRANLLPLYCAYISYLIWW